jgi:hypothetical protein
MSRNRRVLIGPTNSAGQAYLIANALRKFQSLDAESYAVEKSVFKFPVHNQFADLPDFDYQRFTAAFNFLVSEFGRNLDGTKWSLDQQMIDYCGFEKVLFLSHGSDIRVPSLHQKLHPESYFNRLEDSQIQYWEQLALNNRSLIQRFSTGRHLVTTPDLLQLTPDAIWIPLVVNPKIFLSKGNRFFGRRLRITHVPTDGAIKGSKLIVQVLDRLHRKGIVDFLRVKPPISHERMLQIYTRVDAVVDNLGMGSNSLTSLEAMGSGCVVFSDLFLDSQASEHSNPTIDVTINSLEDQIIGVAKDHELRRRASFQGIDYVNQFHSGRLTAKILSENLKI